MAHNLSKLLCWIRSKLCIECYTNFRHSYFRENSKAAAERINAWVSEQTNKKISEILSPGDTDSLTRLIIVSTIYFKADWEEPFDTLSTLRPFINAVGKTVTVKLMHNPKIKTNYGANKELHCKILELPYVKKSVSMFVILPDKHVTGLKEMEEKFTESHLIDLEQTFEMRRERVQVWLPVFKLDKSLSLKKSLSALGMNEMFLEDEADFSGIDGKKELLVSEVTHRAYIEVNEEGSKACAAVRGELMECGLDGSDQRTVKFKADHPFWFFLRENKTRSILFMGRLVDPGLSTQLTRYPPTYNWKKNKGGLI